jgi:hypothetical protein
MCIRRLSDVGVWREGGGNYRQHTSPRRRETITPTAGSSGHGWQCSFSSFLSLSSSCGCCPKPFCPLLSLFSRLFLSRDISSMHPPPNNDAGCFLFRSGLARNGFTFSRFPRGALSFVPLAPLVRSRWGPTFTIAYYRETSPMGYTTFLYFGRAAKATWAQEEPPHSTIATPNASRA